jgi:hypothetical protein
VHVVTSPWNLAFLLCPWRNRGIDGERHRHGEEARGSLQLVDRIEPRWALRHVGGPLPAQSFDLNCRTSLSSQRPNDQGLCCSVFDEEKRSFEDWHKLYITAALTSVTLKESAQREVKEGEYAGHMIGLSRKVNAKSQRTGDSWGALSAATGLKNRFKCHDDDAAGGQGAVRSIIR